MSHVMHPHPEIRIWVCIPVPLFFRPKEAAKLSQPRAGVLHRRHAGAQLRRRPRRAANRLIVMDLHSSLLDARWQKQSAPMRVMSASLGLAGRVGVAPAAPSGARAFPGRAVVPSAGLARVGGDERAARLHAPQAAPAPARAALSRRGGASARHRRGCVVAAQREGPHGGLGLHAPRRPVPPSAATLEEAPPHASEPEAPPPPLEAAAPAVPAPPAAPTLADRLGFDLSRFGRHAEYGNGTPRALARGWLHLACVLAMEVALIAAAVGAWAPFGLPARAAQLIRWTTVGFYGSVLFHCVPWTRPGTYTAALFLDFMTIRRVRAGRRSASRAPPGVTGTRRAKRAAAPARATWRRAVRSAGRMARAGAQPAPQPLRARGATACSACADACPPPCFARLSLGFTGQVAAWVGLASLPGLASAALTATTLAICVGCAPPAKARHRGDTAPQCIMPTAFAWLLRAAAAPHAPVAAPAG